MKGFAMTADIGIKFWERVIERKADTLEERHKIMNELVHEQNIIILNEKRLKDLMEGKKVLIVGKKESHGKMSS